MVNENQGLEKEQRKSDIKLSIYDITQNESLSSIYSDILIGLDDETIKHTLNVTRGCQLTKDILGEKDLPAQDHKVLLHGALMHDIGKEKLSYYLSEDKLTEEGSISVRFHPRMGLREVKKHASALGLENQDIEDLKYMVIGHHEVPRGQSSLLNGRVHEKYPRYSDKPINHEDRRQYHPTERAENLTNILAIIDRFCGQIEKRSYHDHTISPDEAMDNLSSEFPEYMELLEGLVRLYKAGKFKIA